MNVGAERGVLEIDHHLKEFGFDCKSFNSNNDQQQERQDKKIVKDVKRSRWNSDTTTLVMTSDFSERSLACSLWLKPLRDTLLPLLLALTITLFDLTKESENDSSNLTASQDRPSMGPLGSAFSESTFIAPVSQGFLQFNHGRRWCLSQAFLLVTFFFFLLRVHGPHLSSCAGFDPIQFSCESASRHLKH